MKTAKKLLCLMIVLVMAFGMVPFVSAGPADMNVDDYADFDSIQYKEAVDVLTALGVLQGDGDDGARAFRPGDTITRAEASKIIAYILLGTRAADSLVPAATGFRDVPASHWASPFVGYCVQRGIINGYGTGLFGPSDPVTAVQLAKMLLTAVGYGTQGEYVGAGWELRVLDKAMARNIEILSRTGNVDYSAAATREQVAQYTFNALTIPVTVTWNSFINDYVDFSGQTFIGQNPIPNDNLGAKTFNLRFVPNNDAYGYNQRYWYTLSPGVPITINYKTGNIIDSFVAGAEHTQDYMFRNYTWDLRPAGTSANPLQTIEYWINGRLITDPDNVLANMFAVRGVLNQWPFPAGTHVTLVDDGREIQVGLDANGNPVYGYRFGWDGIVDKVIITFEVLARVTAVNTRTGRMTILPYDIDGAGAPPGLAYDINAEGYSVNDHILITPRVTGTVATFTSLISDVRNNVALTVQLTNGAGSQPISVRTVESITARATRYTVSVTPYDGLRTNRFPTVDIDGTTYPFAAGLGLGSQSRPDFSRDRIYYLDSHGSVVGLDARADSAMSLEYLYVTGIQGRTGGDLFQSRAAVASVVYARGGGANLNIPLQNISGDWYLRTYASSRIAKTIPTGAIELSTANFPSPSTPVNDFNGWYSYTINDDGSVNLYDLIADETNAVGPKTVDATQVTLTPGSALVSLTGLVSPNRPQDKAPAKVAYATANTVTTFVEAGRTRTYTGYSTFPPSSGLPYVFTDDGTDLITALVIYEPTPNGRIAQIYVINDSPSAVPITTYGIVLELGVDEPTGRLQMSILVDNGSAPIDFTQPLSHDSEIRGIVEVGSIIRFETDTSGNDYIVPVSLAAPSYSRVIADHVNPSWIRVDNANPSTTTFQYRLPEDGGCLFAEVEDYFNGEARAIDPPTGNVMDISCLIVSGEIVAIVFFKTT